MTGTEAGGGGGASPSGAPAVGFIGLGQMGQPMAARLAGWPGGLIGYDSRPEAMTWLAAAGAKAAGSIEEVAAAAKKFVEVTRKSGHNEEGV